MTSPHLLDDCIYCILKYLQPYHSTLFNCLLVNRFWCKETVPLLYADPFPYSITYTSASDKKRSSIILTFILCLNKTEILQLKSQLKFYNINNIDINDDHKSLFEYPKYLRNFDYYRIKSNIFLWLGLFPNQYQDFLPIFYQSILRQCTNIKQLNIPLCVLYNCNVQTVTSNLEKLNSLALELSLNEIPTEFLNNIGNICLNLRKFEILLSCSVNVDDFKENLCKIIQKQNNLEVIKLSTFSLSFSNDIFLSLEFQKHSLVEIELSLYKFRSSFAFKNLINLCNLKYLKFCNCRGMISSLGKYEILKYASFKLKRLEYCNSYIPDVSLMIKYLGASLQELKYVGEYVILEDSIIKNISTYCLNLITLEVSIDHNVNLLLFKNLKIRILNFSLFNWDISDNWEDKTHVFKNLANNLPTNVKEVYLLSYHLHFKEFLENCHNFLEVIGIKGPINLTLLEIILDYIERSNNDNLKCFGATQLEKEWSEEELTLLNQIKSKGVKIVDFYGIYSKPVGNS